MNNLPALEFIGRLLLIAGSTALLILLLLWLISSRQGRRLRRLLDRGWQPVFVRPYQPGSGKPDSSP